MCIIEPLVIDIPSAVYFRVCRVFATLVTLLGDLISRVADEPEQSAPHPRPAPNPPRPPISSDKSAERQNMCFGPDPWDWTKYLQSFCSHNFHWHVWLLTRTLVGPWQRIAICHGLLSETCTKTKDREELKYRTRNRRSKYPWNRSKYQSKAFSSLQGTIFIPFYYIKGG